MNIFRLAGDLYHIAAIIILLLKIWKSKSCAGVSGRSQAMFALVFTARYLDLFTTFISLYNTVMKIMFIVASYGTLYLIFYKFEVTYDRSHDTFRVEFLVIPTVGLALLINYRFSIIEHGQVAILPQLFMILKIAETETIIFHYLLALASYRGLYIFNWIYRYYVESYYDLISINAGVIQIILYSICLWKYIQVPKIHNILYFLS